MAFSTKFIPIFDRYMGTNPALRGAVGGIVGFAATNAWYLNWRQNNACNCHIDLLTCNFIGTSIGMVGAVNPVYLTFPLLLYAYDKATT